MLDDTLITVLLLGYYENMNQTDRSLVSWRAHINGAAQLLQLRGKQQLQSDIGRTLFRQMRSQIMTHCIWDDREAPQFLISLQAELEAQTPEESAVTTRTADKLTSLGFKFAALRSKVRSHAWTAEEAARRVARLDRLFTDWSVEAIRESSFWRCEEAQVEPSENVWDQSILVYSSLTALSAWSVWRISRIMLLRMQETLCSTADITTKERNELTRNIPQKRRQLADDICASIPACLGHATAGYNSACVLVTAYAAIWPLYFAATCVLERIGHGAWTPEPPARTHTAAHAQATWILGRLDYVSQHIGLKWADSVSAPLRGEFQVKEALESG